MGWWKDFDEWASEPCLRITTIKWDDEDETKELKRLRRENQLLKEKMERIREGLDKMVNRKIITRPTINITPRKKELDYEE